ncbi:MAG: aminoacyl-tRNA hydrolase [Desulfobacteraceae bacterium]|nr:MAG: aminoacyl-tRNA hydrolase [Desulfobacteraceae bacterium]
MYLIVGLGNPGESYRATRHNVGFRVLDAWSRELGVSITRRSFQSRSARTTWENKNLVFLCPLTFMNNSGMAVRAAADYYRVETANVLVIHDDLDLQLGRVKVSKGGGAAGHKGVLSIIKYLGSPEFPRVKVGIGRPRYGEAIEDYVLAPCYEDERDTLSRAVAVAAGACRLVVKEGVEAAMNVVNRNNYSNEEVCD